MGPILITGGNGNLGFLVAEAWAARGREVIRMDVPASTRDGPGVEVLGDIRDADLLNDVFARHAPHTVIHLASLLSGSSEDDLDVAWEINATAAFRLLRLAQDHALPGPFVFASTVATYGAGVPDPMPEDTSQWPDGMYGATKVAVERLGQYFKTRHGLDFRCLRFPLVLSPFAPPSALTAFPSHAFRAAAEGRSFSFPVSPDTGMSTLYLEDVVRSLIEIALPPRSAITQPAYNLHGFHMTAAEVAKAIEQVWPDFESSFEPVESVEHMLTSLPDVLMDAGARRDWGWHPAFDFDATQRAMVRHFKPDRVDQTTDE